MKRILLLTLAIALSSPALHAQLRVGAKGGGSFSYHTQQIATGEWRNSGHVGLIANLYLFEFSFGGFAVQPEAVYNRKGGNGLQCDYVDVPLCLMFRLSLPHSAPVIFAAPYYSFLVRKRAIYPEVEDFSVASRDYGVMVGGGVELQFFQLTAAYTMGMNQLASDAKAYNRGVEVSLGFFFLR
ncbi:MAG: hypothetical protein LBS94_05460 [Prevotellaceae bacterium]|nr:hypothetical protein [Prevotellaceae bacterium]